MQDTIKSKPKKKAAASPTKAVATETIVRSRAFGDIHVSTETYPEEPFEDAADWESVILDPEVTLHEDSAVLITSYGRLTMRGNLWNRDEASQDHHYWFRSQLAQAIARAAVQKQQESSETQLAKHQKEIEDLRERVANIEQILEGVDQPGYEDPNLAWCENNLKLLEKYPDCFVAIDIDDGVVEISAKAQEDFVAQLKSLDSDVRKRLFTTHTSLYLRPSVD